VADFLSDAWFEALAAAGEAARVPADLRLEVQQVIPDGPDGAEVAYVVSVAGGRVRVRRGRAERPDVTFTQDRATAEAIHEGRLAAQTAFIDGRLRLSGDLPAVLQRSARLATIDDLFPAARA
jgi:hypothetical protein